MDAKARALLEEIAYGDGDDVRPADRLRAVELIAIAPVRRSIEIRANLAPPARSAATPD